MLCHWTGARGRPAEPQVTAVSIGAAQPYEGGALLRSVTASVEFTSACPSTATVMRMDL